MEIAVSLDIAWESLDSDQPLNREVVHYVDLQLASRDREARWQRCALTADFLAGFLVADPERPTLEREELTLVIDELLANAVKFSATAEDSVSMTVQHYGEAIRVEASNLCDAESAARLVDNLRKVIEENLEDLFIAHVEKNAEKPETSQLGFITLRLNFGARLGARIVPDEATGLYRVTVAVVLDRPSGDTPKPGPQASTPAGKKEPR